jgi:hypothetical protein
MRSMSPNRCRPLAAPHDRSKGERGAVLILALIMLTVGMLIVGGLTFAVSNHLAASTRFRNARSLQYAARSATDLAIQNIRYTPLLATSTAASSTLNASPPVPCWQNAGDTATVSAVYAVDGIPQMDAWCSTQWTPTSAETRTVTISTCPDPHNLLNASQCEAQPYLQAVLSFDDYPPGVSIPTSTQCVTYCGTGMTTDNWVWSPTVPAVTGLSPGTGTISGGTSVTITGSGFVGTPGASDSSVNFIQESGGAPTPYPGDQVITIPASQVTYTSSTSLTVVAPSVTSGTTYFVTVTTPTGNSPMGAKDVFTYSLVAPTIASMNPTTGSIAGGTSVTLMGTGFVTNSVVQFVQESGGTAVSGGAVLAGNNVDVLSSTMMTVVSPGVVTGTTYFIIVKTPSGTTPTSTHDVFTYSPLVPTVGTVSPNTGPHASGTAVVITGTGFVVGSTVSLVKLNGTCSTGTLGVAATSVTVVNSSTIDAVTPVVSGAGQYWVSVTTPTGTGGCYPIFTYS